MRPLLEFHYDVYHSEKNNRVTVAPGQDVEARQCAPISNAAVAAQRCRAASRTCVSAPGSVTGSEQTSPTQTKA
jgi:hypothetical protein